MNKDTGDIILSQSVASMNYQTQSLDISCSNGLRSDLCTLKFTVIPVVTPQPVWIYPNIFNFQQCIIIREVTFKNY